jgi:hypothetical protein
VSPDSNDREQFLRRLYKVFGVALPSVWHDDAPDWEDECCFQSERWLQHGGWAFSKPKQVPNTNVVGAVVTSNNEAHVLILDQPAFAFARLGFALCTGFFFVWNEDERVGKGAHGALLALVQAHITADLDENAHVFFLLFLLCAWWQRGECWVEHMCVDRLDLEKAKGHLSRVCRSELGRVIQDGAVVGDLWEEFARWEDRLGDIVVGKAAAGAHEGDIVGVCECLGSCCRVSKGACLHSRVDGRVDYRWLRYE